jgi:hypothetical protein
MDYWWKKNPCGQYVDGHERADVVAYRKTKFLPQMLEWQQRMRTWTEDHQWDLPSGVTQAMVVWFHDETIFYAHDRCESMWAHSSTNPKPYAKGEGASLMYADFVSADFGWLRGSSGESAQVCWKPGKHRDGYFTSEDVIAQVKVAMEILAKDYQGQDQHLSMTMQQLI